MFFLHVSRELKVGELCLCFSNAEVFSLSQKFLPISAINLGQWRIQDFPEEGAPTLRGAPTYDFAKFPQKLHETERIWPPGGASKILLCRSATVGVRILWK